MSYIFLLLAAIFMGLIFLAGLYERLFNMPKWFSNPPASFSYIREHTSAAKKIHIPLQIMFLITFIIALILNWGNVSVRTLMLYSIGCFVLIIITTAAYFAREIIVFIKMPEDTPATPEIIKRAKLWERWTSLRNVLQLIGLILLIIACV